MDAYLHIPVMLAAYLDIAPSMIDLGLFINYLRSFS